MQKAYPHNHQAAPGQNPGTGFNARHLTGAPNPPQNINCSNNAPPDYQHTAFEAGYPYQAANLQPYPSAGVASWFEFSNSRYLKGFLLGAGVTFLVTNPAVQKAVVRGAVKLWSIMQGGMEEVKEQIQDIKAEMSQKE